MHVTAAQVADQRVFSKGVAAIPGRKDRVKGLGGKRTRTAIFAKPKRFSGVA
jgi:hypothetical protein